MSIEITPTHYIIDGKPYVRVTEIINAALNKPYLNKWIGNVGTEYAEDWSQHCSEIGKQVHAIISQVIGGRSFNDTPAHIIEWTLLSPEIKYGVMAWMQAQMSIPFKPVQSEVFLISERYGYAGTSDCLAKISKGKEKWLLDWKVASKLWPEVKFQMAAYFNAYQETHKEKLAGARAIRLDRETGKWTPNDQLIMTPEELIEYFENGFLPLLKVYKLKEKEYVQSV